MKHSIKITLVLLGMFIIAQLLGLVVVNLYSPHVQIITSANGTTENVTAYNLPYGFEPPQAVSPSSTVLQICIALIIAITAMFLLMKYGATSILRGWFFIVVALALGVTLNAFIQNFAYSSIIALVIAIPVSFLKIFQRNMWVHNISELLIYPGIAAIFVPFLNVWTAVVLLVIISIYDIYAVWHSGIMQKMAKYQIKTLRLFSGFYVPYLGKKERELISKMQKSSKMKNKKVKVNLAILGGGDVVFPIIMAGVALQAWGLMPALCVTLGATLGLAYLFYSGDKGKFYPAMPFITIGCFIGLILGHLI